MQQKMTGSQLSLPHRNKQSINQKELKEKTSEHKKSEKKQYYKYNA